MTFDDTDMVFLVVGDMDSLKLSGLKSPQIDNFHFCAIEQVNQIFIARLKPDVILSSLITKQFDIVDLIDILNTINYCGQVRAISTALPDTQLICSEIQSAYPDIDFDLLEMP